MSVATIIAVTVGILLTSALLYARIVHVRRERARDAIASETVFREIYGALSPLPRFEVSSSYGYPALLVVFASKTEMNAATRMNDDFRIRIGSVFKGRGSASRPFEADRAIFFTYEGWFEELKASFDSQRQKGPNA